MFHTMNEARIGGLACGDHARHGGKHRLDYAKQARAGRPVGAAKHVEPKPVPIIERR